MTGRSLLYTCVISLSSFLLFAFQPMIAKALLPRFGGSASVWATCLFFFQALLLGGYYYAHILTRVNSVVAACSIHLGLLAVSLLTVPIVLRGAGTVAGAPHPEWELLVILALSAGLPYLLLSTTSPMVQVWYARERHLESPYKLYALSNAASVLALVGYPVLIEPLLGVRQQLSVWSWAYWAFAFGVGLLAVGSLRSARGSAERHTSLPNGLTDPDRYPGRMQLVLWFALSACSSTFLLAVTGHITQELAPVPFLWVLPLALYLLSWIICFASVRLYRRRVIRALLGFALPVMGFFLVTSARQDVRLLVLGWNALVFICFMFCHGELALRKPHPRFLTSFYLAIAFGGAVGGLFVSIVAPSVFSGFVELSLAVAGCAFLALVTGYRMSWLADAFWIVLLLVLMLAVAAQVRPGNSGDRQAVRNFYGLLRVVDFGKGEEARRTMIHGGTSHGTQFLSPSRENRPTAYYGPVSGIGLALANKTRPHGRVGVVGLGAGTLAAYGRPGEEIRFYEINPQVERLAREQFRFIANSKARVDVVLGDARLSLERERRQEFDILAVDAFSGDAIPVHLLTVEAFETYFRHLAPKGVLAVHITNTYLDLSPVVGSLARLFGKDAISIDNSDDGENGILQATWILVTDDAEFLEQPAIRDVAKPVVIPAGFPVWTDDYSNLIRVLK